MRNLLHYCNVTPEFYLENIAQQNRTAVLLVSVPDLRTFRIFFLTCTIGETRPALQKHTISMEYLTRTIARETVDPIQIIDVTDDVRKIVASCGLEKGQITLVSQHTTAFVNINEQEPGLLEDMITFLKRLVPKDGNYLHNIAPIDGRDNAHSHLMGLFMNSSETVPFESGKLLLGRWQSIFLVELDGPRPKREILVHISGRKC